MAHYLAQILLLIFLVNTSLCVCAEVVPEQTDPHAHHQTVDCVHDSCSGECGIEVAATTSFTDKTNTSLKYSGEVDGMAQIAAVLAATQLAHNTGPPNFQTSDPKLATNTPITRGDCLVV